MSAIQSGAYPVTLNGTEYGLLFSLNALDAIQDKFGGYDKLHIQTAIYTAFSKGTAGDGEQEENSDEEATEGGAQAVQES